MPWAAYAGTTRKKPLSVRQKQLLNNNDTHILDWIVMPTGQVKTKDGVEVYKRGYVNAVRKLLVGESLDVICQFSNYDVIRPDRLP